MKKNLLLTMLLLLLPAWLWAGDVVTSDAKRLPDVSRDFIKRHFPSAQISHIKIEEDFLRIKKYEVLLTDRTEIEFDGKGNWIEVECDDAQVPSAIVPEYVTSYLKARFPTAYIVKIERHAKKKELEVELNNDLSLTFNSKGELIDIDD